MWGGDEQLDVSETFYSGVPRNNMLLFLKGYLWIITRIMFIAIKFKEATI